MLNLPPRHTPTPRIAPVDWDFERSESHVGCKESRESAPALALNLERRRDLRQRRLFGLAHLRAAEAEKAAFGGGFRDRFRHAREPQVLKGTASAGALLARRADPAPSAATTFALISAARPPASITRCGVVA